MRGEQMEIRSLVYKSPLLSLTLMASLLSGCDSGGRDLALTMESEGREDTRVSFILIDKLQNANQNTVRNEMKPTVTITSLPQGEMSGEPNPVNISNIETDGNFEGTYSHEIAVGCHRVDVDWQVSDESIAKVKYFLDYKDTGEWSQGNSADSNSCPNIDDQMSVDNDGSVDTGVLEVIASSDVEFNDTDDDKLENLWELNIGSEWMGDSEVAVNSPIEKGILTDAAKQDLLDNKKSIVFAPNQTLNPEKKAEWGTLGKLEIERDDGASESLATWNSYYTQTATTAAQICIILDIKAPDDSAANPTDIVPAVTIAEQELSAIPDDSNCLDADSSDYIYSFSAEGIDENKKILGGYPVKIELKTTSDSRVQATREYIIILEPSTDPSSVAVITN